MSNPNPKYYFPTAPREYNQQFMNEVIRSFSLFTEQLKNPGKVTASELNLRPATGVGIKQYSNNREAYDDGLLPGDVWMLSTGEIRIVVSPNVEVPVSVEYYNSAEGKVGDVITFDASAEIGDIINPMEPSVGDVSITGTANFSLSTNATTASVGEVTLPSLVSTIYSESLSTSSNIGSVTIPNVVSTIYPASLSATANVGTITVLTP